MTALAWYMLLLNAGPYIIGAGIIVLVVLIIKLWRMK